MKKIILTICLFAFANQSFSQNVARQFNGVDCNNKSIDLFADLDSGKAVVLFYFMANCSSCHPKAQVIQDMTKKVNLLYPGLVKGYAFPYINSTSCTYTANWVSSNALSDLFQPVDSGASDVAYYGGFGMPSIVLLGGKNREVMFFTKNFSSSDTIRMRDSILTLTKKSTSKINANSAVSKFDVFMDKADQELEITFELHDNSNVNIQVYDILGKPVLQAIELIAKIGKTQYRMATSDLQDGTYIVQMESNGMRYSRKVGISK